MRRKIETEERDNTKRASFICTQCKKTYTDLEANQLCDLMTGEFRCCYCGDIVEEDASALPKADSRLILAKFNEQIEPLYILLKEVEDLKLSAELLEPEPLDVVLPTKTEENKEWNSIDKNRGVNNAYEMMLLKERSLTVNIETVADGIGAIGDYNGGKNGTETNGKVKKERPIWLTESTLIETNGDLSSSSSLLNGSLTNGLGATVITSQAKKTFDLMNGHATNGSNTDDSNDLTTKEILEALLIYEKQNENNANAGNVFINGGSHSNLFGKDKPRYDHHNHDTDDSADQYEYYRLPTVRVQGQPVAINEVNEDHLPLMSADERALFVKLSHHVYTHLYE